MFYRVLHASDFEYANILNIQGFSVLQGCEYARVLNMLLALNMLGFWKYTVLIMSGLHRVLNMPNYA